jgi:hypothetical protein
VPAAWTSSRLNPIMGRELLLETDEGTYERPSSRPHRTDVEPIDCEGQR